VQLGQVAVVGGVRNFKASQTVAGAALTFAADAVVVKSATGGIATLLTAFSEAVNLATVGAGGMDIGSAPVSGYVAVYASWGAVAGAGVFATNATSAAAPEQYSGANPPSGVTETQLISVWPTNASRQFVIGSQLDRSVSIASATVLSSSTTQASPTALNISSVVPLNARYVSGFGSVSSTAVSSMFLNMLSSSVLVGQQSIAATITAATSVFGNFIKLPIALAQTMYYTASSGAGTPSFGLAVTGYEF
jgi:hypothetical protein